MKRNAAALIAMLVGVAVAGAASAQARHDEKSHGYDKAAAAAQAEVMHGGSSGMPSAAGGRHDEKPHNAKKAAAATAKDAAKSSGTTPAQTSSTPEGKKAAP